MKAAAILKKITLLVSVPLLIAAGSAWVWLHGGRFVKTENAYVKAQITSVSSEINGKVVDVLPRDNQPVHRGDVLVRLAPQPHRIALAQAEAALANIRRDLESQKVEYQSRLIEVERAKIEADFHHKELERARQLLEKGAISSDQFDNTNFDWQESSSSLAKAQQELEVARSQLIDPDLPVEEHPAYRQALAELDRANLTLSYTEVQSPLDGVAVNVSARLGENILMGAALLNVVDDSHLWIEANLKETELTHVQTGQPVEVHIDAYPGETWHGRVSSITPATGAEFALLPPQNSSGNWVKVVQRITVDIDFDEEDKAREKPVLTAGMSAMVSIDTGFRRSLPWID